MRKIQFSLVAAVLVFFTAPVLADEDVENDWRRSGWYVVLNGTYNLQDISPTRGGPVDDSLGVGLKAGWRFKNC